MTPFLRLPLRESDAARVDAWLTAIGAYLANRYGDSITAALEPVFVDYAAEAVGRRLAKRQQQLKGQATGPSSAQWTDQSARGGWFLPEELEQMDSLTGRGGVRSVRTPVHDAIRFGNASVSPAREALLDEDDFYV